MTEDDFEYEPPVVDTLIAGLTHAQFLRLCDVAVSSRRGMIDRAFPSMSRGLQARGYLKSVGEGWQITEAGSVIIRANSSKIPSL